MWPVCGVGVSCVAESECLLLGTSCLPPHIGQQWSHTSLPPCMCVFVDNSAAYGSFSLLLHYLASCIKNCTSIA